MFYNRQEHYRHMFGKPHELTIHMEGSEGTTVRHGLLLDISPRGGKLFLEQELVHLREAVDVDFTLNHEKIRLKAILLWKENAKDGWIYGMEFIKDPIKEMLIGNELKAYRELE